MPVVVVTDAAGLPAPRRRTVSVIASGSRHATQTLTAVRVRRRTTGPATMPGRDARSSGTESSGMPPPWRNDILTATTTNVNLRGGRVRFGSDHTDLTHAA